MPSTWATFRVSAITTEDLDRDGYDDLVFSDRLNNRFEVLREGLRVNGLQRGP